MAKILIAEDELLINELLQRNLKPVGHICTPAFDGNEALRLLDTNMQRLMLLDIMLPEKDGFPVMRAAGRCPTIFLTAQQLA